MESSDRLESVVLGNRKTVQKEGWEKFTARSQSPSL